MFNSYIKANKKELRLAYPFFTGDTNRMSIVFNHSSGILEDKENDGLTNTQVYKNGVPRIFPFSVKYGDEISIDFDEALSDGIFVINGIYPGDLTEQEPFIIKVNSGTDGTFTIPTYGGGYNYNIRTSDDQFIYGVGNGNKLITFPNTDTEYEIEISGSFPRIYFNNIGDKDKLVDIKQWGDIEWTSMQRAFRGCSNTTCTATDKPIASNGVSLNCEIMFQNCNNINFDLASWNLTISNSSVGFLQHANEFDSNGNDAIVTLLGITYLGSFMQNTKVKKVIIYGCENLDGITSIFSAAGTFRGSNDLIGVELHGMRANLNIMPRYMTVNGLTGTAIDDLANSVADMSGQTSPSITMTMTQYNSCDVSLWTNKNWTILT